ncbi:uncharacterized protein LOC121933629 [Sceloporus undulatus]|uniref:uncharacterized protein LOC121933629 n=1 Tax=Sceloporus undulatus TaxID=8520 RepID=UPI001C4D2E98|nr:uncharacterized protein LOC121933629 [Sceloporus undulatus]
MPEQQQSGLQLRGNQCNMTDILQRISLSKPPVDQGMYSSLYISDYKPYSEYYQHPPVMDRSQKLKLEAQLKQKEFAKPVEKEPVRYVEEPICQEVVPPYPIRMDPRVSKVQGAPLVFQEIQDDQRNDTPPTESSPIHPKEGERLDQQTDGCILQANIDGPCFKQEQGQNWSDYQQFLLESRRSSQAQVKEIKKLNRETSVFPKDYIGSTEASTYQRDYKYWPRDRSGYSRANRNFSSLFLEDSYYKGHPWMSEYMDNYNIFLKKLQWSTRNPVSSFCSAVKPIPHLSHGMPSQTPIAVNTAL